MDSVTELLERFREQQAEVEVNGSGQLRVNGLPQDHPLSLELKQRKAEVVDHLTGRDSQNDGRPSIEKFSLAQLREKYPTLPEFVIDGLLRQGEIGNLIAASKIGKSWFAYVLLLSIVTRRLLFDKFECAWGKVLLIDNELHRATIASRLGKVGEAMGLEPEDYDFAIDVWPLRGKLRTLYELTPEIERIEPGEYKLILLDAKYRFTTGASENDNANEAMVYNTLDQWAEHTKAAIVVVHHSSKGDQSEKEITDVGSGAGAQSRAADAHMILRPHEEEDVFVFDAAVRSFAPIEPMALRWEYPLWLPDSADPYRLRRRPTKQEQQQQERDREAMDKIFAALRESGNATNKKLMESTGLSRERQQRILNQLLASGDIEAQEINIRGNICNEYYLSKTD